MLLPCGRMCCLCLLRLALRASVDACCHAAVVDDAPLPPPLRPSCSTEYGRTMLPGCLLAEIFARQIHSGATHRHRRARVSAGVVPAVRLAHATAAACLGLKTATNNLRTAHATATAGLLPAGTAMVVPVGFGAQHHCGSAREISCGGICCLPLCSETERAHRLMPATMSHGVQSATTAERAVLSNPAARRSAHASRVAKAPRASSSQQQTAAAVTSAVQMGLSDARKTRAEPMPLCRQRSRKPGQLEERSMHAPTWAHEVPVHACKLHPRLNVRHEVLLRIVAAEEIVGVALDAAHGDVRSCLLPRHIEVDGDVGQLSALHFVHC